MLLKSLLLLVMGVMVSGPADAAAVTPLHSLQPNKRSVTGLAFSPDNKMLAASYDDKSLRLIDINKGAEIAKLEVSAGPNTLRFTPDGKILLAIGDGGAVSIDVQNRKIKHLFQSDAAGGISAIDVSPDGKLLAAVGRSSLSIWNIETGVNIATIDAHGGKAVNSVAFSPDGQHLATIGDDKKLITWSCLTSQLQKEIDLPGKGVCTVYTSGGDSLIVSCDDRTIHQVNASNGDDEKLLSADTAISLLVISPDRPLVIIAGMGPQPGVLLCDKKRLTTEKFSGHETVVVAVAMSRDGRFFASGDKDGKINIYPTMEAGK